MKFVAIGFINKFIEVKDDQIKKNRRSLDNLDLALKTRYNPYKKPIKLSTKNCLSDPEFSLVTFQRVCEK
jgi:hypothetical protein